VAIRRSREVPPELHRLADRLIRLGYTVQRLESTALKLCWIGSGEYAGMIKPVTNRHGVLCTWALTPGLMVAQELGVVARTIDGRPWRSRAGEIAVGDAEFFHDIRPGSW
jgi:fructose-1,6-bisphosphatase/inositol monophosphatase family enzyme